MNKTAPPATLRGFFYCLFVIEDEFFIDWFGSARIYSFECKNFIKSGESYQRIHQNILEKLSAEKYNVYSQKKRSESNGDTHNWRAVLLGR